MRKSRFTGRADRGDPAWGGSRPNRDGGEAARGERADDLHVAQAGL